MALPRIALCTPGLNTDLTGLRDRARYGGLIQIQGYDFDHQNPASSFVAGSVRSVCFPASDGVVRGGGSMQGHLGLVGSACLIELALRCPRSEAQVIQAVRSGTVDTELQRGALQLSCSFQKSPSSSYYG